MPDNVPDDVKNRVEGALKLTIESELQRAAAPREAGAPLLFSRGAIFSKSNGFDKGIFFSKNSAVVERFDETELLSSLANIDDQTISVFAQRLAEVQNIKNMKTGGTSTGQTK